MSRILLFDIDGTLIRSGGAAARALERALEAALGLEEVKAGFSFAGMTDPRIFRRMLEDIEQDPTEELLERVFAHYEPILREEIAQTPHFRVNPGMREGLEALATTPQTGLGLGTGNIETGARIKLDRAQLNHYFAFGGFGSDAEDRAELLRVGAERGAAQLGLPLEQCRVLVVGDTPLDVAAAHTIGARCLAVATGGATREELAAAGADYLFDDLTAPGALETLLAA